MKKIIRLSESDLTRIVKRVIREQAVSSAINSALDFPENDAKVREFNKFIDSQSVGHQGLLLNFVPISYKTVRVNDPRLDALEGYRYMYISKENLPKDIKTNPCYSNLKLDTDGSLGQVDVKLSCKKEYEKLVYIAVKNPL